MKLYENLATGTHEAISEQEYNVKSTEDYGRELGVNIEDSVTLKEFRKNDSYKEHDLLDFDFINTFGDIDVYGLPVSQSEGGITVIVKENATSKYTVLSLYTDEYLALLDLSNKWDSTDDGFIRDDIELQVHELLKL